MANKKVSSKNNAASKKAAKKAAEDNTVSIIIKALIAIVIIVLIVLLLIKACKKNDEPKKENKKPVADVVEKDENGFKKPERTEKYDKVVYLGNVESSPEVTQLSNTNNETKEETNSEEETEAQDTTAPTVEGVSANEVASSFIIYAADDVSYTSGLSVTIDGVPYNLGDEYTENGDHTLVVTDEAGNSTEISFTVATIVGDNDSLARTISEAAEGDIIVVASDKNENAIIDKSLELRSQNNAVINGYVSITSGDVTLDGVTIKNTTSGIPYSGNNVTLVKVDTTGSFTMKNSTIEGNTFYARNAITINNASSVEITDNTFGDGNIYNYIEFGGNTVVPARTNISGNTFTSGSCTHNQINMYNFASNSEVNVNNNYFAKSANAVRIANRNNATATINMNNNKYDETDSDPSYAGLMLAQPWNSSVEDFSTITVNINNLTRPDSGQVYYTWNTSTSPVVYLDGVLQ